MRELIKALLKTGSSSIASIIFGMITTKIIAITTGAAGVGLFSQLRQILLTNLTLSTLNGQNALIQGISSKDNAQKEQYIKTVFLIYCLSSSFIAITLFVFADILAQILLNSSQGNLIRLLALIAILSTFTTFFFGILNGYKHIGKLAITQILSSFIVMIVTFPLIQYLSFNAIILILLIGQIISFLISGLFVFKINNFNFLKSKFSTYEAKYFIHIAVTTFVIGIVATISLLVLKTIIIQNKGLAAAGIFDAAWTLSTVYVGIILSSFSTYYLPTLSGLKNKDEQTLLIQNILRITTIIMIPVICSIIILKPMIIEILYSHEFTPTLDIIRWLLIGDFLKVTSWILAMPAFAFVNMKVYFWTEIISNLGFLILSAIAVIFYNNIELIGIVFIILYCCNFLYFLYYTTVNHNLRLTKMIVWPWISGLGLIILTSTITWTDKSVNWPAAFILIPIALLSSLLAINKDERSKLMQIILRKK